MRWAGCTCPLTSERILELALVPRARLLACGHPGFPAAAGPADRGLVVLSRRRARSSNLC